MYVRVSCKGDKIFVKSPYNEDFIRRAHSLSGKWNGQFWVFPKAVESELKNALLRIYGEDGEPVARFTVDLVIPSELIKAGRYSALGRIIVENRWNGLAPGEDVAILSDDVSSVGEVKLRVMRVPQHVIDRIDAFIDAERVRVVNIAPEHGAANAVRADHAQGTDDASGDSSPSLNDVLSLMSQAHVRSLTAAHDAIRAFDCGDHPAVRTALEELVRSVVDAKQLLEEAERVVTTRRLSR